MSESYRKEQPTREEIEGLPGVVVLNFGTDWCGYCSGAAPHIERGLAHFDSISHVKVEDGPGRPLGRSYKIKLWPTLIVLKDGQELGRIVRPTDADAIAQEIERLVS